MKNSEVQNHFLLLLLECLQQNNGNPKETAKSLGYSRQRLEYHLKKLKTAGLLKQKTVYPYSEYELTGLAQRCKKILGQDEKGKIYRIHARILGFPVKEWGNFKMDDMERVCPRKVKRMQNWRYYQDKVVDGRGEWCFNVQDTGLLKIYVPEAYSDDQNRTLGEYEHQAVRIAETFAEGFDMEIGLMRVLRPAHVELIGSERLGELIGRVKSGGVWIDASTGTNRLEQEESENVLQTLVELPKRLSKIEGVIVRQSELMERQTLQMDDFSRNVASHTEVIKTMVVAMNLLNDTIKGLNEKLNTIQTKKE